MVRSTYLIRLADEAVTNSSAERPGQSMIRLIHGAQRTSYPFALSEMFKLRKRVFHDRLGWCVETTAAGWECDRFDELDPLYVLNMDDEEQHVLASLRMLPTIGPHMLSEVFPQLVSNHVIRGPTIWEVSRFCVDHDLHKLRSLNHIAIVTAELLYAVGEIGLRLGLTQIVAATDICVERIFRHMGCPGERLGETRQIGKIMCVALAWNDAVVLNTMKSRAHITSQVIRDETAALPHFAKPRRLPDVHKRKTARGVRGRFGF